MFVVEEGCVDHDNENETNRIMLIKINTVRSCNIREKIARELNERVMNGIVDH